MHHHTYTETDRREAIYAAMLRTGDYQHLNSSQFEAELEWTFLGVPINSKGLIQWRGFPLGRSLVQSLGEAQNWRCCYCGVQLGPVGKEPDSETIEHVREKALGGRDHPDNLVLACYRCNSMRGTILLARMRQVASRAWILGPATR